MYFRKQFQYMAIGCFCTLAGVLLSSSVLPLFGKSGEDVIYENIFCKTLTVTAGEDNIPIAMLGSSKPLHGGTEDYGMLLLSHKDSHLHEASIFTNSGLIVYTSSEKSIVELGVLKNGGRLKLNNDQDDGFAVIGEKDEGGFSLGIFGSGGTGNSAGASLSVEGDKGQLFLFGENNDILFGRGKIIHGQ